VKAGALDACRRPKSGAGADAAAGFKVRTNVKAGDGKPDERQGQ
jgi:hypothetical protein